MKKQKSKNKSYRPKCQPNKPVGWRINFAGGALFKGTD